MEIHRAFGIVFERIRTRQGVTKEQFLGIANPKYVRTLENGDANPSLGKVWQMCAKLEVPPDVLIALAAGEAEGLTEEESIRVFKENADKYLANRKAILERR
ncbi:helix-turn-helix domain-containing protein [Pseudomonas cichorii]|nr:helix-turn-helix transcriptional regulator [Pseudomonas cichorii]MBX8491213.1 helix-turn-helix domain-containing protein [Pseudomonas cichorii]